MTEVPDPVPAAPEPPPEAVDVFGAQLPLARRYADLLATTGIAHGLVGPREAARLWERHLVNCAVMESLLPLGSTVVDVGSGAGLPGLALAVARPDLRVHLVEPLLRRTTWLEAAVAALDVGDRVTVHRGRAEEVSLVAPVVTARAVASLDKLVRWSFPLLEPGGRLLALKGHAAQDELDAAWPLLQELGVAEAAVHVVGEGRVSEPVRVVEVVRPAGPAPAPGRGRARPAGRSGGAARGGPRGKRRGSRS
jgi:16S rRNA (guanine527-N7)-methyltransferase